MKFQVNFVLPSAFVLAVALCLSQNLNASEIASISTTDYAGTDIGDVSRVRGNISALYQNLPRTLNVGGDIKFMDTIITGDDTRAEMVLIDDSILTVGDDTVLAIDEMIYDPNSQSQGIITLTKGVFRMVSGKINKTKDGQLTLRTPLATIGVRGTDFWGLQEDDKLTMAVIDNGIVEITGVDGNTVILDSPLEAVVIERGQATPTEPFSLTVEQLNEAAKTVQF